MTGFLGALRFLTRIPIPGRHDIAHDRTLPWFPLAGAAIGVVLGVVAVGMTELVPVAVAAATAVIVGLLITGAFHEDGLADCADAFGGGWTVEQRLEIMKDSRHGTYGVAAMCASIVLRTVALASIPSQSAMFGGLIAAHTLGRGAAVGAMLFAPPASDSGLGAEAAATMRRSAVLTGLLAGSVIVTVVVGWWVLALIVGAAVAMGAVTWLAVRKIGGLAGDVLGAIEQVTECVTLVVVSGLAARYSLWWA